MTPLSLEEIEAKALEAYRLLKELAQAESQPTVAANARRALSSVWQIVNNLGLKYEQLHHLGV